MKLKTRRDDFVVREICNLPVRKQGKFSVYRLNKSGVGTAEALQQVQQHWGCSQRDIASAGRKDRQAVTSQVITILGGPNRELEQAGFTLAYIGAADRQVSAEDIVANEFLLKIRDLAATEREAVHAAASQAAIVPNYFDQQRFGSVSGDDEFVMVPWCLADYERALFLALAQENPQDPPPERAQREILRTHWGQWMVCKDNLEKGNRRSVVTYLVDHPTGYKKAVGLIRRDMRSLYVAALQSRLWNEVASRLLGAETSACEKVALRGAGALCFPKDIAVAANLRGTLPDAFPLPSARKTAWHPRVLKLLDEVCEEMGIPRTKLRIPFPRDVFFSRANRRLWIEPTHVEARIAADDTEPDGESILHLKFRLERGQYATTYMRGLACLAGLEFQG